MICIQMLGLNGQPTGSVFRTTRARAEELVRSGAATYSSKGEWKAAGRHYSK